MQDLRVLSLKKIGILVCFQSHKAKFGKYPKTPEELRRVTASLLEKRRFNKYKTWFLQFTGESE